MSCWLRTIAFSGSHFKPPSTKTSGTMSAPSPISLRLRQVSVRASWQLPLLTDETWSSFLTACWRGYSRPVKPQRRGGKDLGVPRQGRRVGTWTLLSD